MKIIREINNTARLVLTATMCFATAEGLKKNLLVNSWPQTNAYSHYFHSPIHKDFQFRSQILNDAISIIPALKLPLDSYRGMIRSNSTNPRAEVIHALTVRAFSMVSAVVKVFETTTTTIRIKQNHKYQNDNK